MGTRQKPVLIHTESADCHAIEVQRCLETLGVPSVLLLRERCFQDWTIVCDGDDILVNAGEKGVWEATQIRSVFWRRDYLIEPSWIQSNDDPGVVSFLAHQRSYHVKSAFLSLAQDVPFINHLTANETAASKHLQQRRARECGLAVPATYIGNDPGAALRFAQTLWHKGSRCCTKNMESIPLQIAGADYGRLTHMFNESDVSDLAGLAPCPMIFQEYIEKKFEYRVTVVGDEVFACQIDSQRAGGKTGTDWRHYNIPATPHLKADLPNHVCASLVRLVAALGLTYGAADLVENPDGEFYFLELNSAGQWLWIEHLTDLPISMAIARHLADENLLKKRGFVTGNRS